MTSIKVNFVMLNTRVETEVFDKLSLEENIMMWLIRAGFQVDAIQKPVRLTHNDTEIDLADITQDC